jgi:hypothetical protein
MRGVRLAIQVTLALGLVGCAASRDEGSSAVQPAMLSAIKAYYEHNAAEQNNVCKGPLMDGVTRSELVSQDDSQLVVEVGYKYRDYTSRRSTGRACSGFGSRTFTLSRDGGRFRVIGMSGEVRTSPSLRIW